MPYSFFYIKQTRKPTNEGLRSPIATYPEVGGKHTGLLGPALNSGNQRLRPLFFVKKIARQLFARYFCRDKRLNNEGAHQGVPIIFFNMNIKKQFTIAGNPGVEGSAVVELKQAGDDSAFYNIDSVAEGFIKKYIFGVDKFEYIVEWASTDQIREGYSHIETSTASILLSPDGVTIGKKEIEDLSAFIEGLKTNPHIAFIRDGFSAPQLIIREHLKMVLNEVLDFHKKAVLFYSE